MDYLARAQEIFSNNIAEFQRACALYKSMLDKNFGGRFCIGEHCRAVFMIEIKFDGYDWGATPKMFYSEAEAKIELEILRQKYPFVSEWRIVTRKEKEKD